MRRRPVIRMSHHFNQKFRIAPYHFHIPPYHTTGISIRIRPYTGIIIPTGKSHTLPPSIICMLPRATAVLTREVARRVIAHRSERQPPGC